MTSPQQIEVLDLRHFTARQLRPLLDQEAEIWQRRLRWDYRSSIDLLLQYLDSRILPGFVALIRGRICGYTFFVYEGSKAVVGDLYVEAGHPAPLNTAQTLARHLLDVLEASPDVDRIEAQLLLYGAGSLPPLFPGFTVYPRLFMESSLRLQERQRLVPVPAGLELCSWAPGFYQPSAELIQACYTGHLDSEINDQYRSLQGSLRFLHNIVRFPGCGTFDPESSWVLRRPASGTLAGIVLCSRVAPMGPEGAVAHVTQLCVAPAYRGQHLGRLLLEHCMRNLPARHHSALTLTVTEANREAVQLYQSSGFETRHRFDALVLDKQRSGLSLLPRQS